MFRLATKKDENKLLKTARENMKENIYLYINIWKYGLEKDFVKVWINEHQNNINQIILKYYDSFQVYSDNEDYSGIIEMILSHKPNMISGTNYLMENIFNSLNKYYRLDNNVLLEHIKNEQTGLNIATSVATFDDMEEIGELISDNRYKARDYSKH